MAEQIKEKDCHHLPQLDEWLGVRAIITTTKGICKGRLEYQGGWYYCQAAQQLIGGEWIYTPVRFLFRKSQFRKIEKTPTEDSCGR